MTDATTNFEVQVFDIFEDNWGNMQMEMVWRGGLDELIDANEDMTREDFKNLKDRGDEIRLGGGAMAGFTVERLTPSEFPEPRGKIVDISNMKR